MVNGPFRRWLHGFLTQTAAQVVGGLILLVFAAIWAWMPSALGYLTATTEASVWLLGVVLFALVSALLLILGRGRTRAASAPVVPSPPVTEEGEPAPPEFHPFRHLDLDWEIQPAFLNAYRSVEAPAPRSLDDWIKGPFCLGCRRSLRRETQLGWMADWERRYTVENPCPRCGRRHGGRIDEVDLHEIKAEVYKEAQRLARAGKFPTPNSA